MWNRRRITIFLLFVAIIACGCLYYVNDYYRSDVSVKQYLQDSGTVKASETKDGLFLDGPGSDSAIVFYPGAKVEYTAYIPMLHSLSERGIDVFLTEMPFNLAFLGKNKAKEIMDGNDYDSWYLCGHSLGGAMAAAYAAEHPEGLDGLVLLAAYPTKSLTADSFSVLSLYGSEDGILNMEKVETGREYMPEAYTEISIQGGNHSQFGDYGEQKGDGEAAISKEEQQKQTADAIYQMITRQKENSERKKKMTYEQISAEEAKNLMEQEKDVLILDVRTQEEFASAHIRGAVCVPNEDIPGEPEELPDKAQKILVYCRSGNRSRQAAQKLADMGYENVLEFGGILDWPYPDTVE